MADQSTEARVPSGDPEYPLVVRQSIDAMGDQEVEAALAISGRGNARRIRHAT